MADPADLGDLWRHALRAQADYVRAVARLTEMYGRAVVGTVRAAASAAAVTPRGPRETAAAAAGHEATHGTGRRERRAERTAAASPPAGGPVMALEAEAGSVAQGVFLVENVTARRISAPLERFSVRDQAGREIEPEMRFEPDVVTLDRGEQALVQVALAVGEALEAGVDYRGEVRIPGIPGTAIPVVVRRLAPAAPSPRRRRAATRASTGARRTRRAG